MDERSIVEFETTNGIANTLDSICIDGTTCSFGGTPLIFRAWQEIVVRNIGGGRVRVSFRDQSVSDPVAKCETVPSPIGAAEKP